MTPQQLEALVLSSIDCVRAGGQIEDDRIEVKREWPGTNKARQLAGAANRARGDSLIYIIGLDEKTGIVHPTGATDAATWWPQMKARFDQLAPDLVRHLNVPTGPGESVTAILFSTDRAPYIVNAENGGSPEREVPIREGTRTRSATRVELLRMLSPQIGVPSVVLLSARMSERWQRAEEGGKGRTQVPEKTNLTGEAEIFIEHVGPEGILFPRHEMRAEWSIGELRITPTIWLRSPSIDEPPAPAFGVQERADGFASTGPGVATLKFRWDCLGDLRDAMNVETSRLTLRLGVTGSSRPVLIDATLNRSSLLLGIPNTEYLQKMPSWAYSRTNE